MAVVTPAAHQVIRGAQGSSRDDEALRNFRRSRIGQEE